jgi:zinc transport system permease protein
MLIVPAATARNLARGAASYIRLALLASMLSGVAGFIASYYWKTATGATIVLFGCGLFLVTLPFRRR